MASLSALPRRWFVFLGIALLSLVFLYQIHDYSSKGPKAIPAAPYSPPPKANDGRYHWTDRLVQYPVKDLQALPSSRSKRLPRVQHAFTPETGSAKIQTLERRSAVKDAFVRCWSSYRQKAWMRDELSPISGSGRDSFGGWSATLVDALDTLWIMDLKEEFHEAVHAAESISFATSTEDTVNVFETTIRYLGGFLAAYDLSGETLLLDKAVEIGEMLLVPFDTPNHMPITRWDWQEAKAGKRQQAPSGMLVSELGSLTLEFTRLSQLTGDNRWYDAIQRVTDLFDAQQHKTKVPGLWPVVVNPRDKDLASDNGFTLGGMSDSLYEYFPKEYALLGGLMPVYRKLYEDSMRAAIKHLFFRPLTPTNEDILIAGDVRSNDDGSSIVLEPRGQHLTCFVGGMLGLGGRLFSDDEHVRLGQKITDGCVWAYKANNLGVMPEIAHFLPCDSNDACTWDRSKWTAAVLEKAGQDASNSNADEIIAQKKLPEGFTEMNDRRYILRPEAIESVFIMYRITGQAKYREAAWEMFTAIQNISETQWANAAIPDITAVGVDGLPPKEDRMESFWLAETLKYFYLIFSESELISLDEYVLNTEAHPLRRPV